MEKKGFELGQVLATRAITNKTKESKEFAEFVRESVRQHASCNWGDLDEGVVAQNEQALEYGGRLISTWEDTDLPKIWIITKADRSATMIHFPGERLE